MFVSQDKGIEKKAFVKPNILRKNSKIVRLNSFKNNESPGIIVIADNKIGRANVVPVKSESFVDYGCSHELQDVKPSKSGVIISEVCDNNQECATDIPNNIDETKTLSGHDFQTTGIETCTTLNALKVESEYEETKKEDHTFVNINKSITRSSNSSNYIINMDGTISRKNETENTPWCLDSNNSDINNTVTTNLIGGPQLNNIYLNDTSEISAEVSGIPLTLVAVLDGSNTSQEVTNEMATFDWTNSTHEGAKLMCTVNNCNKTFWTESRLEKHISNHNKSSLPAIPIECPVRGTETACGRTFMVRAEVNKHLEQDHSLEEAEYCCGKCGRRFFWAMGLRTHASGGCGRALVCGWPGCGRQFRQPCRLREHARAHTGDRPYPCTHPGCGWAFRSASKLVRHARRHTGERRHACAACGRAFLRREHLRDHEARHHAPRHEPHHCTQPGCEQSFANMSSLYLHMKKVHRNNDGNKTTAIKKIQRNAKSKKEIFVVNIESDCQNSVANDVTVVERAETVTEISTSEASAAEVSVTQVSAGMEEEGRSARTHCTWPLQRAEQQLILEDDSQVEQSENSDNNFFTVRSDLFLHGNVLINEDSEFNVRGTSGVEEASASPRALLDAHPSVGLMQEELMYADAAVDESSFRVFLLNGEELS